MQLAIRILLPILILAGGWYGYSRISVKPEKPKRPPPKDRVIRTEVLALKRQNFQTVVRTQGVVRPHDEAVLTSQVAGKVTEISGALHDGSFFEKGEVLLKIDREDFETEKITAEANLARAKAAFAQEQAKAKQARLNWEDLGYDEEPNELVLRLPQLREAEANVKAAEASLERAERNLERTTVRAPFAGRVLQRNVSVGQTIAPSTELARVFGTDFVEVRLPVAPREMAFLALPESAAQPPVDVELRDALRPDSNAVWRAKIVGTEGALDEESRELFAIARVSDPFSRIDGAVGANPLRVGQPVLAAIEGRVLSEVLVVPRSAVRQLNHIFLVNREELTLERREIEAIWSNEENLVVADSTIEEGALLATSRLVYSPHAAKVEIVPAAAEGENAETPALSEAKSEEHDSEGT